MKHCFNSKVIEQLALFSNFLIDKNKTKSTSVTELYGLDFKENKFELHKNVLLDVAKAKH